MVVEEYNENIIQETTAYNQYIKESDKIIEDILKGKNIGCKIPIVELIEIIKEGELRFKYNIAPGFSDSGKDDKTEVNPLAIKTDKFGDLIVWKEILKKAKNFNGENIVFVTNDTAKGDWFTKEQKGKVTEPRVELFEEFNYHIKGKELQIITYEQFLEQISDEISDRDLLLEIRKELFINRFDNKILTQMIDSYISKISIFDLINSLENRDENQEYLNSIIEENIEGFESNDTVIDKVELFIQDNLTYQVEVTKDFHFEILSNAYEGILSAGVITGKIKLFLEIQKDINKTEKEILENFKLNPKIMEIKNKVIEAANYYWSGDFDTFEDDTDEIIEGYTTCPKCARPINNDNDAGNGFCVNCSE